MNVTAQEKRKRLREILNTPGCTPAVGVFDALGARMVEKAGFEVAFIGSYALAAFSYGLPDVGSITLSETVDYYKNVAECIDIPLIADADNGYFNSANIWRTVREMEKAGISGIHIEDHELGKHMNFKPRILETETMCKKIKAAAEAKTDENFIIIARTDSAWIKGDPDEVINRLNAYLDAGADAAYLIDEDFVVPPERYKEIHGPVVAVCNSRNHITVEQESEMGISLSLYWNILFGPTFHAIKNVLDRFKETGDLMYAVADHPFSETEINEYIRVDEYVDRANKYLL